MKPEFKKDKITACEGQDQDFRILGSLLHRPGLFTVPFVWNLVFVFVWLVGRVFVVCLFVWLVGLVLE